MHSSLIFKYSYFYKLYCIFNINYVLRNKFLKKNKKINKTLNLNKIIIKYSKIKEKKKNISNKIFMYSNIQYEN